jgi:hypothetical protein
VIRDLDGGDPSPSRAGVMRAISVVLAFGAIIGWAALSSPVLLRGPYATPDPAGGVSFAKLDRPRFTPAPFVSVEPAAALAPGGVGCIAPGAVSTTQVFVGGQLVTVSRPVSLSVDPRCETFYLQWLRSRLPIDRIAR